MQKTYICILSSSVLAQQLGGLNSVIDQAGQFSLQEEHYENIK